MTLSKSLSTLALSITLATGAQAQQSVDASTKEPGAAVSPSGLVYRS